MNQGDVIMEWLMDDTVVEAANVSLARMTLAQDTTSELHSHPNCSEAIHLLSGKIEQRIGDEWHVMQCGQTCLIPQKTKHQTRNIGNSPAVMILAYSEGKRIYSLEA